MARPEITAIKTTHLIAHAVNRALLDADVEGYIPEDYDVEDAWDVLGRLRPRDVTLVEVRDDGRLLVTGTLKTRRRAGRLRATRINPPETIYEPASIGVDIEIDLTDPEACPIVSCRAE
jgi:hypothetical protein